MTHIPAPASATPSAQLRTLSVPDSPTFAPLPAPESGAVPRLQCVLFHSAILPDDRVVSIYLPPDYVSQPQRRFPVFYLHDGQNLFDPVTSYIPGHTWRAGETADRTAQNGHAESVILVGIANTGLRRMAEYTPTRDYRMGGGDGDRYGRLLIEELKPWIDANYRTLPDPQTTGLGGSSLGGLISLYLGLLHSSTFTRLGVLSPSIWWDHRSILNIVANARPRPPLRIWLDIGTAEGARHVRDTELLERRLIQRGFVPNVDLKCTIFPNVAHTEDAWAERFDQVLAFLFPPGSTQSAATSAP